MPNIPPPPPPGTIQITAEEHAAIERVNIFLFSLWLLDFRRWTLPKHTSLAIKMKNWLQTYCSIGWRTETCSRWKEAREDKVDKGVRGDKEAKVTRKTTMTTCLTDQTKISKYMNIYNKYQRIKYQLSLLVELSFDKDFYWLRFFPRLWVSCGKYCTSFLSNFSPCRANDFTISWFFSENLLLVRMCSWCFSYDLFNSEIARVLTVFGFTILPAIFAFSLSISFSFFSLCR